MHAPNRLAHTGARVMTAGVIGALLWPIAPLAALAATNPATANTAPTKAAGAAPSGSIHPDTATAASPQPPKLSMDQAQKIVESTFPIPDGYVLQSRSYNDAPASGQPPTYNFTYQSTMPAPGRFMNVSVDANTGLVVNFNQPPQQDHFVYPVPVSADKAQAIAQEWAQKLYPNRAGQVKVQPLQATYGSLLGATSYTYNFERMVGGIPAPFDGFAITIGQNGELLGVRSHWTDAAFPDAGKAIPKAQADDTYRNALQLHLEYQQIYHPNGPATSALLYVSAPSSFIGWPGDNFSNQRIGGWPVIDATSGKIIDAAGDPVAVQPYQAPKPLVPGGPTLPVTPPKVNWSQQAALDFARQALGIQTSDRLQSVNQWQPQDGQTTWNFTWQTADGQVVSATVDATYGRLTQFNQYSSSPEDQKAQKSVSQAQITEAVNTFVKRVFAGNTGAIAVIPMPVQKSAVPSLQTDYQVVQLVHGIPDQARSGSLHVDPQTGRIQSFWMNGPAADDSADLPDPSRAIPLAKAQQAWLTQRPLSLVYLLTQPAIVASKMGPVKVTTGSSGSPAQPRVVLAYTPLADTTSNDLFNAVTGQFEPPQTPVPYTGPLRDIDGVPGADQIRLLVSRQLIPVDADGNVHPSQNLTNGTFVKLLVDALGYQYRYDAAAAATSEAMQVLAKVPKTSPQYQEIAVAYELGWLPQGQPFDPDAAMTRGFAATLLARALGYGPLLAHPDLFQLKASDAADIGDSQFAAAALSVSLGLLPLQSDRFNAGGPVRLSDAAIAVVQAATLMQTPGGVRPL
ncbi:YcdB/YcdC domain-containing protein [Alicyclobacillus macrosporangiidus]|uniref:YcdB/YcdC domain-containing protein n=1 Tax=Alicyclobacillus macrosporangiidus TaxID=392015 RepID=UPI00049772BB|nr:YcdB/YcdC domain-containing protein [Alicyclobacillus macrosporangiidus]